MIYYILNLRTRTFEVRHSAEKVGTYMLGKSLLDHLIIKTNQETTGIYLPTNPDVFVLQKELEEL